MNEYTINNDKSVAYTTYELAHSAAFSYVNSTFWTGRPCPIYHVNKNAFVAIVLKDSKGIRTIEV